MDARQQPRPWFDPGVLHRLQNVTDVSLVKRMIESFLVSAEERLQRAHAAAERGDWDTLGEIFHSLISSAGNLGGFELMERCREGYRRAATGHTPAIRQALREVDTAYHRLTPELRQHLGRL